MLRHIYILLAATVAFCVACSTQKNTALSRTYQKLTSSYNVYFNGIEAFEKGKKTIEKNSKNDYSHVLPVYAFADEAAARAGSGDMETALKKAHKLIQLHSITAKPERKPQMTEKEKRFYAQEEFNPYVSKAWLLIVKANVLKHSEEEAAEVVDYIVRTYENTPEAYEAKIWKAIAYAQLGQYINARSALESYDKAGVAPEQLYGDFMAAYANMYICQLRYREALPYMETAVKEADNRYQRNRYTYILAQLYRQCGYNDKAAPLFLQLSRSVSDYDMAFAAKLDLATVATTAEQRAAAEKQLRKMSRDAKNADQLDQIYYAIGQFEQGRGHETEAIGSYRTAIAKSLNNNHQKGLAFIALADIYIAKPRYIESSAAYDSAAFYLDRQNQRQKVAASQSKLLKPLAKELINIRDQDSLLRVAQMPDKERNKLIDDILEAASEAERQREEARLADEEMQMSQSEFYQLTRQNNIAGAGSPAGRGQQWYFYNPTMVSAGKSTFASKWGRRANEDNWRRSNKESTATAAGEDDWDSFPEVSNDAKTASTNELQPQAATRVTRETLLAALPLTPEAQQTTNQSIANSLFASGVILYDDVHDYPSAQAQLAELLRRYPRTEQRYNALVILYFAQSKANMTTEAQQTAAEICRSFPDTHFARQLSSGDALTMLENQKLERELQYETTYAAYLSGNFAEAESRATNAMLDTANASYTAKYLLVRSLSYAKQARTELFRADLETITSQYRGGAEDSLAIKLLAMLDKGQAPVKAENYESPLAMRDKEVSFGGDAAEIFVYQPDTTHAVACIVAAGMENRAQFLVADYNFSSFLLDDYDIAISQLADGRSLIVVRSFAHKQAAMNYLYSLREQTMWKELTDSALPEIYAVSDNNFKLFLLRSAGAEHSAFFDEHYLGKTNKTQ